MLKSETERPNIIFLHTDQQTWDAISAYGNNYVATPNIDRLHHNGISFMRAYCTDPVCAPARTSWMTGRFSSETGVPFNGGLLHEHVPDLGQHLNANGIPAYHTGKWHVPARDVTKSFKTLYFGGQSIVASAGEFYDTAITRSALNFLTQHSNREPFFLQIGLINPHDICEYGHNVEEKPTPDGIQQGIVTSSELPPLPKNFHYDNSETMTQRVFRREDHSLIHWEQLRRMREWSEEQWRYHAWNLYRLIEKVDSEIGILLNAIEATKLADNTLIIFTSDHGEASGQHQMFQKFTLYEESCHVPFIAACLGKGTMLPKGEFDHEHLISGVDIFPTVCDYMGISEPSNLRGLSIRPLLERTSAPWREHVFVESNYWGRAIINGRYKYITERQPKLTEDYITPGPNDTDFGIEQLFDLIEDPNEIQNVVDETSLQRTVTDCRALLSMTEDSLERKPLRLGKPRLRLNSYRERMLNGWELYNKTHFKET